jgi:ABC-2 type transport system ATP-binding protein
MVEEDMQMIEVENLSRVYQKTAVVKDVSAVFPTGKISGIVGRNGSGKTVLFRMICGLVKPTSGSVTVNGERIGKDVDYPSNLGVIIETPGFLPFQSGYRNLLELARINRKIRKQEIRNAMEQVGLQPDSHKPVGKYSLGMRQRLGIAQAIMENPDVLILDEPMNGLDEHGVEEMRALFSSLREKGKTILLASHNKEDIEFLCDHVFYMDGGVLR